jgi:hypothetical protein
MRECPIARLSGRRRLQLLSLALLVGASACRTDTPFTRRILALMDSRAEQIQRPRCLPSGRRNLRAALRRPTVCIADYQNGNAVWHRDEWGSVLRAARTWRLSAADSLRWAHLRDSVTGLVVDIVGEVEGCSREVPAAGARLIAWHGSGGRGLVIHSFERPPGEPDGYALRFEVHREDTLCTLSQRRAYYFYRPSSPASRRGDSTSGTGTVLDSAARAAGLPVLRTVALSDSGRELRFSAVGSGMVWQPDPLLRLVEHHTWAFGELFFYWPRLRDSTGHPAPPPWVANGQSGCRVVQSTPGWAACRVEVQPGITWRVVADSLRALGIWELPLGAATEQRGSHLSDRDGVVGEVLMGDRYGRFEHYDLNRPGGEYHPRVRAAAALLRNLPVR